MIYYTADHHFGHEAIIEYCNRPFKNATKMDQVLISRYRSIVKEEDTVFFIGDFSIKGPQHKGYLWHITNQLPGHKVLILGNHDKLDPFTYVEIGFESVHTSLVVGYVINHDPAAAIIRPDLTWLCGHIHTFFKTLKNVINVGVDVWEFYPVSKTEIEKLIKEKLTI